MEVVIAVTIVSVTLVAVYGLIISVINVNARNIHNLQASEYAAEGLEVIRFMRDSNWLQNYSWNRGALDLGTDDDKILYLHETESSPYWEFSAEPEKIETANGNVFTREIVLKKTDGKNSMEVISNVFWDERGIAKTYSLSTYLSDWHD